MAKLIARPPVRGSYFKLVRLEKKLAVELVDACHSSGASLNDAIKEVNSKCTLFSTLCKSSYKRFKVELATDAAGSSGASVDGGAQLHKASGKRAGRPSTVTEEYLDAIKAKVRLQLAVRVNATWLPAAVNQCICKS
jgi:hypothetical protein